jgi:hypothetical protein
VHSSEQPENVEQKWITHSLSEDTNRDRIVRSGALVGVPVSVFLRGTGQFHGGSTVFGWVEEEIGSRFNTAGGGFEDVELGEKATAPSVIGLTDKSETLTEAPRP